MKIYLVGGAVRDELLHFPVKEKDYVVVGATPEEMMAQGFRPVGKEFPVFLHPETQEEYALARTERKVRPGYTGFVFNTSPDVTLEDDLMRRDLTINAMAKTAEGNIIDPYHGQQDLKQKILRHVSPAFSEDPVRILRIARFAARYKTAGFSVAPETLGLMKQMVKSGEVNALVPERVFKELEKALIEDEPSEFFKVLDACGALAILFPSIKMEDHGMKALRVAVKKIPDTASRFAVLMHDKAIHEINELCDRYRMPTYYRDIALITAEYLPYYQKGNELSAEEVVALCENTDAFRRFERFKLFLAVCDGITQKTFSDFFLRVYEKIKSISVQPLLEAGYQGPALAAKIREERIKRI